MANAKLTVLMSVFNGERFLKKAVGSVLSQTFSDFEFLILDDCSTDNTWNILINFHDSRIRLIKNRVNMGLTRALNKGLGLARGEYVARMDADDISLPERLQRQKTFLDKNRNIAMVGCWVEVIDENGQKTKRVNFPIVPYLLRWRLLLINTFAHSAVMFRKDAALGVGGYSEKLRYAQDYDLWSRISIHWDVANIPNVLVQWRFWKEGISAVQAKKQGEATKQIAKRNIGYVIGEHPDETHFECLKELYTSTAKSLSREDIDRLNRITSELLDCFCQRFNYRNKAISEGIKVEISTHVFFNIFRAKCSIIKKGQLMLCWIKKFKPNPFRIFFIFFFRRTGIGTRIQGLFRQNF
jgi:glycosyltransferase involved in cell wall biosynthesis